MIIGERILELRLERKISQAELGLAIGVNARAISYWENNVKPPKASYIYELAKYFGGSADYLLGLED
jgi:transcriptional regulator with XRE-family HTH domain